MSKEMMKKYQEIKKSVEALSGQLADLASEANDELRESGGEVMDQVVERFDKAVDVTKQKTKEVNEFVSDNPWATIAVVSLAALALGYFVSQGKSRQK